MGLYVEISRIFYTMLIFLNVVRHLWPELEANTIVRITFVVFDTSGIYQIKNSTHNCIIRKI